MELESVWKGQIHNEGLSFLNGILFPCGSSHHFRGLMVSTGRDSLFGNEEGEFTE
jgi:hypothetical protein